MTDIPSLAPRASSADIISRVNTLIRARNQGGDSGGGGGVVYQVFDVVRYGALGDGTTNDWPAIDAAYSALLASDSGGEIYFPPDRTYRVASTGVHGLHLFRQSNVTIRFGDRAKLVMDNLVGGLAVSHGIYVEGPCENISIINAHVMFATLTVSRQTWAPIYFMGDNVGGKDVIGEPYAWYRGNPDGSEDWPQIEAGAVRNILLENVTTENSPSVGIGIVGVDGLVGRNITVKETWADGLYCRYFRGVRVDGYLGKFVGDDGFSLGTEDSDLAAADIELPFHGEGSMFTNVVLEGRHTDTPAGSIVLLGVRDVVIDGVVVIDRFRGIKLEPGTQRTFDNPAYWRLNLNFLANRRVLVTNLAFSGLIQDISLFAKEVNYGTDPKWWYHDMIISNVIGENGSSAFDFACVGIPMNGGPPLPITAGITFENLKFTNYASPYTTFAGAIDCTVNGMVTDGFLSIQGFVPYGFNPDLLDGDGNPMWPDNRCTYRNIRCSNLIFQGLKRSVIEDVQSVNALTRGIVLTTCADVSVKRTRVLFPNRSNDPLVNGAFTIDEFCKRISWDGWEVEQDGNTVHAMGLGASANHWVDNGRVQTTQNMDDEYVSLVTDRRWLDEKISQVGRVDWYHSGSSKGRGRREFPRLPLPEIHGDTNVDVSIGNQSPRHRVIYPLSADRTYILHENRAAIGDRIEVVREATSTGPYSIIFKGQTEEIGSFPTSDAKTSTQVFAGPGGQVSSILLDGTTELLGATVTFAGSSAATAAEIAAQINAYTATSGGFTASSFDVQLVIYSPAGSLTTYNGLSVVATVSGDLSLSVGFIPRMDGGTDSGSAGERGATADFLFIGDNPTTSGGSLVFSGGVSSITVNGTELLAAPVAWQQNSRVFASLVAAAAMANFAAHEFKCFSGGNGVFIQAPPGNGAGANGWPVVVTPTGDVTTYDVKPMAGGVDPPVPAPAGTPYDIITTAPDAPFRAIFEFTATGWILASLVGDQPRYPNGIPLSDNLSRLIDIEGNPISDEFKNRKYASGAVLGWDSGMLAMGLSAPPSTSSSFGKAGMMTWDSSYLYCCIADNDWRRIPWETF